MRIKYSPDVDALIITFREGKPVDSRDIEEGIIAHYSEDKEVLEIEILDASKVIQLEELDLSIEGLKAAKA